MAPAPDDRGRGRSCRRRRAKKSNQKEAATPTQSGEVAPVILAPQVPQGPSLGTSSRAATARRE